jgi:hypothetical protein
MKKHLIIYVLSILLYTSLAFSQDTISIEYVKHHTYEFQLSERGLEGVGGTFLTEEFRNAQFVLLGEFHGEARISQFTAAILPELAKVGFSYFCLETGPHSTRLLSEICKNSDVPSALSNFYSEYYKEVKDIPIPFLEGIEDAEFLKAAINNNYTLFGIDQEYYSSTLLLLNALLSLDKNKSTIQHHGVAATYVKEQQLIDAEESNYPLHSHLLESLELKRFFNSLDTTNVEINRIIEDLKMSWRIYELHSSNLNQNLEMRSNYMKRLFATNYKLFSEKNALPKILIKMGAYHTMRGITYNAVYDIGNLVSELSDFNGTKDVNIGFLFRYYEDDKEPEGYFDNSIGESNWLKQRQPLLLQGQKDNWVVIDLKNMKDDIINKKIWCYPDIQNMMYDVDLVIIPPMAKDISINYKKE